MGCGLLDIKSDECCDYYNESALKQLELFIEIHTLDPCINNVKIIDVCISELKES